MAKKFDPRKKDQLTAPEREEKLHPKALLQSFGLQAGNFMADIGCGPGFFTIPAAEIVGPNGKVYAADMVGGACLRCHGGRGHGGACHCECPVTRDYFVGGSCRSHHPLDLVVATIRGPIGSGATPTAAPTIFHGRGVALHCASTPFFIR